MRLLHIFIDGLPSFFRQPTTRDLVEHQKTLIEVAELADGESGSQRLEEWRASNGVPADSVFDAEPQPQKWSEMKIFDRATFDYDAYMCALEHEAER